MAQRDDTSGRKHISRLVAAMRREPTSSLPTQDVRIKLETLPMPLRAVARHHSEDGLMIEAELPWLTVGSAVEVELPEGPKKGHANWFGIDATHVGAARLRIFVDLSPEGSAALKVPHSPEAAPNRKLLWWSVLCAVACLAVGVLGGLAIPRPARPSLLAPSFEDGGPPPARLKTRFIPKALPEVEQPELSPPPPVARAPLKLMPKAPRRRRRR